MTTRFRDRIAAGQQLANRLQEYVDRPNVLVLGLPRGGVPVAHQVAQALEVPLAICLVRKLGVPGHKEIAMGAIASGGVRVLNQNVIDWLKISDRAIDQVAEGELQELRRRERAYRGDRPRPTIEHQTVILIDDGLATGATIRAAIAALKTQQPEEIIVAVPVAPKAVYQELQSEVDKVVVLSTPEPFNAIGLWYENFDQTTDQEVQSLLAHPPESALSLNL